MRQASERLQAGHRNEGLKVTLWWLIHEEREAGKHLSSEDEIRGSFRQHTASRPDSCRLAPPPQPTYSHILHPPKNKKRWWDTVGAAEFWQAARRKQAARGENQSDPTKHSEGAESGSRSKRPKSNWDETSGPDGRKGKKGEGKKRNSAKIQVNFNY